MEPKDCAVDCNGPDCEGCRQFEPVSKINGVPVEEWLQGSGAAWKYKAEKAQAELATLKQEVRKYLRLTFDYVESGKNQEQRERVEALLKVGE